MAMPPIDILPHPARRRRILYILSGFGADHDQARADFVILLTTACVRWQRHRSG
jgi:hypothetical protein